VLDIELVCGINVSVVRTHLRRTGVDRPIDEAIHLSSEPAFASIHAGIKAGFDHLINPSPFVAWPLGVVNILDTENRDTGKNGTPYSMKCR